MPWPFLPPNPDTQPAPFDGDIFAFSLQLEGMSPFDEHQDHRFYADGVDARVFVPLELDATAYKYGGVGLAPLTAVGTTVSYEGLYVPQNKSNSANVSINNQLIQGEVSSPSVSWSGSKVDIKVDYSVNGGGWSIVAVPYMHVMPKFSSQADYAAAFGSVTISGTTGTAIVTVTPGPTDTYAVFVAQVQSGAILPASSALEVNL
jgi:hypothetical protein